MDNLKDKLDVKALEKFRGPLNLEANLIMTESKRDTPVDTGTLRGSGHVQPPKVGLQTLSVTMGFGGAASAYAIIQHERTDLRHQSGTAKFLERNVKAHELSFARRLVKHLDLW
jgi:hypothetical protein